MQQVALPDEALAQWFAAAIDVPQLWAEARAALSGASIKTAATTIGYASDGPHDVGCVGVLDLARALQAPTSWLRTFRTAVHGHITKALPHSPLLAAEAAGAEPCTPRTSSS